MTGGCATAVRIVAAGLAVAAYVIVSHYAASLPASDGALAAAIAVSPYLAAAAVLCWRARHRYAWLLSCAALAALAWRYAPALSDHAAWVCFLQHAGSNAVLAAYFGSTLLGNRTPLCSRFAAVVHGPLVPRLADYTRRVTLAWTIYFAGTAVLSALLFAYAPIVQWSVFANLLAVPLVMLMFAAEYVVRLRVLPDIRHAPILDGIRLYLRGALAASRPPAG